MTQKDFRLRRYWQVFSADPRRRWCLPCAEWFVGRNDCPLCGGALVIEQPQADKQTDDREEEEPF
jgi:hypothetical protein